VALSPFVPLRALVVIGLVWTAALPAQSARAPAPDPPPRPFRGRVVAAIGRDPLPRARIAVSSEGAEVDIVLTDDRGRFSIPLARPSDLVLTVTKAGYAAERVHVLRKDVLAAAARSISLQRGAAVSGRVAHQPGRPAMSIPVVVRREKDGRSDAPDQWGSETDDRGDYRVGGLPAGRYVVTAGASRAAAITVTLKPGDDVNGVNLVIDSPLAPQEDEDSAPDRGQMRRGGTAVIRGRVIADSGEPLAGARIRLMRHGMNVRTGAADVNGHYSIEGIAEGRYTLQATTAGYVPIEYGQRRSNEMGRMLHLRNDETLRGVEFVLPRGSAVTGNIADEHGEAVEGAMVRALQVRFVADRLVAHSVPGVRERRSDDRGQYRLFGLLPGTYLVTATVDAAVASAERGKSHGYAPSYYPGTANIAEAWPVSVEGERDVHGAHVVLSPSAAVRVSGIVRDRHGNGFKGLMLLTHSRWSGHLGTEPRTVPVSGTFLFTNVPPGDYVLQATAASDAADPTEFVAEYVRVAERDVSLSLTTTAGATLSAQVSVEGGVRVEDRDYSIVPVPADFDRSPIAGSGPIRIVEPGGRRSFVGLHGPMRFVLSGAPAGWYLKRVSINGFDATDVPYDFTFRGGWSADARIVISPNGGTIRGRVVDDQSEPVSEYTVIVYAADRAKRFAHSRFTRFARPSQDDSFEVTGLPPGDYRVAAVPSLDVTDRAGDWHNPAILDKLSAGAHRVNVEEGAVLDLTLRPVGPLSTRR
jgi:protocatechuate 3,4-dioxygenase beta subunit